MPYYVNGDYTKQAHVSVPPGTFEEEFGRDGFYGPVSHVYHRHAPTGWIDIDGPLRPQAFDCNQLSNNTPAQSGFLERVNLLFNDDVTVSIARYAQEGTAYFQRNSDGDELFFIHRGHGQLQSDFGTLPFCEGDYIIIPKGTTYRFLPQTPDNFFLVCEGRGLFRQPDRGMLGQHALYDQSVIEVPHIEPLTEQQSEWQVKIKRLQTLTTVTYPFNPIDIAGWKGDLSIWKLNVKDICPVMSHRAHLPPSVHTTFLNQGFVICTFLPRPLENAPEAQRVPFYHRNIDYDEVIFYHSGDFFSRDGIGPGMITLHPQGIHHGPHPKALANQWSKTETEEVAVMIDTKRPLHITAEAQALAWTDYWKTWQIKPQEANA